MVELMENNSGILECHTKLIESGNGSAWLRPIREAALQRFAEMGFPTTRDEDWRFTNVAPIARTNFEIPEDRRSSVTAEDVERFAIPDLNAARLVFINGRFSAELSSFDMLPKGVVVLPLSEAAEPHRDALEPVLNGHDLHAQKADAFAWLNTAFAEEGAFIRVEKGKHIEQPIELLSITVPGESPTMMHPRNVIIGEVGSEFTVVERYVSLGEGEYFTNAITDIVAHENAVVNHYLIEEEGREAFNISTLRTHQETTSNVLSHTVLLGGKLVRNNVHPVLDGDGIECLINGLFIGSDQQHMDNFMRVEHCKEHGDSRQFYKGILDDRASGVFAGRIVVHPGAQKTDAKQTSKNLLLSREAHVDTKPQLEIYADDVKCTHGATIGQLDEQAIFYLQARGISKEAARSMLIHSFAGESLERMKNQAIRIYLDKILFERLPGGDLLEHML